MGFYKGMAQIQNYIKILSVLEKVKMEKNFEFEIVIATVFSIHKCETL